MHIVSLSLHGLIRGDNPELGRDADTGGQVRYVLEQARALAGEGHKVTIVTRLVDDPAVSADYARPLEVINENVRIVRVRFGPDGYLPKEDLWPHLDEARFAVKEVLDVCDEELIIHAHYADSGYVAFGQEDEFLFTPHSLGRVKRRRLLAAGLPVHPSMARRIGAEEIAIENARCVIVSSHDEAERQLSLYGRPRRVEVIPPGFDAASFYPGTVSSESAKVILAVARPDESKNLAMLVHAYGHSDRLQSLADLTIVAGQRDDVRDLPDAQRKVIEELLYLMDLYDLHYSMQLPKHVMPNHVSKLMRGVADNGGVFVNLALAEPFGLTTIEAAACGLPVVVANRGGPAEVVALLGNGATVDPSNVEQIQDALINLLTSEDHWSDCRHRGFSGIGNFSWQNHARKYSDCLPVTLTAR